MKYVCLLEYVWPFTASGCSAQRVLHRLYSLDIEHASKAIKWHCGKELFK